MSIRSYILETKPEESIYFHYFSSLSLSPGPVGVPLERRAPDLPARPPHLQGDARVERERILRREGRASEEEGRAGGVQGWEEDRL